MILSCSCDWAPDDWSWYWEGHSEFIEFVANRRKRCCSCNSLIGHGSDCVQFYRFRTARTDIEERIYGDHVPLASHFMCETCGGLYFALEELGYGCLDIGVSMKDYVAEYNEMNTRT